MCEPWGLFYTLSTYSPVLFCLFVCFPGLGQFPPAHSSAQLKISDDSAHSSLSVQLSPLTYSIPHLLAMLISQNPKFLLLTSVRFRVPIPAFQPGNSFQAEIWSNYSVPLVCFPFLRDHCSMLAVVQYLKTILSFILSGFPTVQDYSKNPAPVLPPWLAVQVL